MFGNSEEFGHTVHLHSLVLAITSQLGNQNQNYMCWPRKELGTYTLTTS